MSPVVRPLEGNVAGPSRQLWGLATRVVTLLPAGADLTDAEFERRHRAIIYLIWAQAVATFLFGLVQRASLPAVTAEALLIVSLGAVAAIKVLAPRFRAAIATLGLISTSAAIVQLSGGTIEAHFHFFVMLAVIAIYQDWIPFLLAILYVAIDHGVVGTLFRSPFTTTRMRLRVPGCGH